MRRTNRSLRVARTFLPAAAAMTILAACGPNFGRMRAAGQKAMHEQRYGAALEHFKDAYDLWPENARNMYDMGVCHLELARRWTAEGNDPAALREVDRAIWYFSQAIEVHPGMQAAVAGKNEALELKGRYDAALREAQWASEYVGPGAREQIYLAKEYEERGDVDAALLRFRQAVAMEPDNPRAHAELGYFLRRHGKTKQAVGHFRRAYQLDPLNKHVADALTALGEPLPRTSAPPEP